MDELRPFTRIRGRGDAALVFTCEHASNRLPQPWSWHEDDQPLIDTHWASDIGAAAFTMRLASLLDAPAVLSEFSRLLVDPNRPLDSATLFRREAEGRPVQLNAALDEEERQRRLEGFYHPYHDAVRDMVGQSSAEFVFGVHTFTAEYEGQRRSLEVGILFDEEETAAVQLVERLRAAGFDAAPNEPYSGKEGLAYSPVQHARAFGRRALEIEVRQDLVVEERFAARLAAVLADFF